MSKETEINYKQEMTFTAVRYGNSTSIIHKFWHTDPPEVSVVAEMLLSYAKEIGINPEAIKDYFYDIVREEIESENSKEEYDA